MVYSVFTLELCSHCHNLILEYFHHTGSTPPHPTTKKNKNKKTHIHVSSHLGEIFLTDHGCHVLFFWNLTSQTLRSSLKTFSPISADEEIEAQRSKAF